MKAGGRLLRLMRLSGVPTTTTPGLMVPADTHLSLGPRPSSSLQTFTPRCARCILQASPSLYGFTYLLRHYPSASCCLLFPF